LPECLESALSTGGRNTLSLKGMMEWIAMRQGVGRRSKLALTLSEREEISKGLRRINRYGRWSSCWAANPRR